MEHTATATATANVFADKMLNALGALKDNQNAVRDIFADTIEYWAEGHTDSVEILHGLLDVVAMNGEKFVARPMSSALARLNQVFTIDKEGKTKIQIKPCTPAMASRAKTIVGMIRGNSHFFDYRAESDNGNDGKTPSDPYAGKSDQFILNLAYEQAAKWLESQARKIRKDLPENKSADTLERLAAQMRKNAK